MNRPKYILDSYALLAYFQAEPAGAKVRDILKEATAGASAVFLSVISFGEIYYIVTRVPSCLVRGCIRRGNRGRILSYNHHRRSGIQTN